MIDFYSYAYIIVLFLCFLISYFSFTTVALSISTVLHMSKSAPKDFEQLGTKNAETSRVH